MNKPVKTYINDSLILEIKRLLMNTSLSIKEISYKTGFEDPTNFVKYFKKYTELTPIDFRKRFWPKVNLELVEVKILSVVFPKITMFE